jgi:hypothetical protein
MRTLTLDVWNQYGSPRIRPANEVAEQFAALLGRKTFDLAQLEQIARLGFSLEVTHEHPQFSHVTEAIRAIDTRRSA